MVLVRLVGDDGYHHDGYQLNVGIDRDYQEGGDMHDWLGGLAAHEGAHHVLGDNEGEVLSSLEDCVF